MKNSLFLFAILILLASPVFAAEYTATLTISVASAFPYMENTTPIVSYVNFTELFNQTAYNSSIRVLNKACSDNGVEIPSDLFGTTVDSSGLVEKGVLYINPNGTVTTSGIKYCLIFNDTPTASVTYSNDNVVVSNGYSNSNHRDVFNGSALNETNPTQIDNANWTNFFGNGADLISINNSVIMATGSGIGENKCELIKNNTIVAFNCTGRGNIAGGVYAINTSQYSLIHIYYPYTYFKNLILFDSNKSFPTAIDANIYPNGTTRNLTLFGFNETQNASYAGQNLSRGIVCGWGNFTTYGFCYATSTLNNNTGSTTVASSRLLVSIGGRRQNSSVNQLDSMDGILVFRIWITGTDNNFSKVQNITNYWEGYVTASKTIINSSGIIVPPVTPPTTTPLISGIARVAFASVILIILTGIIVFIVRHIYKSNKDNITKFVEILIVIIFGFVSCIIIQSFLLL